MQKEKKSQTDSAHAFFPGLARLRPLIPKLFTKVTHQLHFVFFFATHPYVYALSALALQCESRPSAEGKPGQGGLESGSSSAALGLALALCSRCYNLVHSVSAPLRFGGLPVALRPHVSGCNPQTGEPGPAAQDRSHHCGMSVGQLHSPVPSSLHLAGKVYVCLVQGPVMSKPGPGHSDPYRIFLRPTIWETLA